VEQDVLDWLTLLVARVRLLSQTARFSSLRKTPANPQGLRHRPSRFARARHAAAGGRDKSQRVAVEELEIKPVYLSTRQGAIYANVSKRTIERAIKDGHLRATGGRGLMRIKPEWIDEWLEHRMRHPGEW
jgi:excisionase family DNA binding protein